MKKLPFTQDNFQTVRGSWSRWKELSCRKCQTVIALYQKDGPGPLYRSYVDRFAWSVFSFSKLDSNQKPILTCPGCQRELGILSKYRDEDRPALLWLAGAVVMHTISQKEAARKVAPLRLKTA